MQLVDSTIHLILGILLVLSSMGVILLRNPVHACLSFLVTLVTISVFFLQLSAEFLSVIQILVYAGAILVLFIFALVLFQDAYQAIAHTQGKSRPVQLAAAICITFVPNAYFFWKLQGIDSIATPADQLPPDFGKVMSIGKTLYTKEFFPLEAVAILFLIALVGSIYLAKKEA